MLFIFSHYHFSFISSILGVISQVGCLSWSHSTWKCGLFGFVFLPVGSEVCVVYAKDSNFVIEYILGCLKFSMGLQRAFKWDQKCFWNVGIAPSAILPKTLRLSVGVYLYLWDDPVRSITVQTSFWGSPCGCQVAVAISAATLSVPGGCPERPDRTLACLNVASWCSRPWWLKATLQLLQTNKNK